jgi:hypothetical protein
MTLVSSPGLPITSYDDAHGVAVALGASSVRGTLPISCATVLLSASGNCWYKVGTASALPTAVAGAAGNDYLGAGQKFHRMVPVNCVIAVIQDGTSTGTLVMLPVLDV